jgi:hypothetical protein
MLIVKPGYDSFHPAVTANGWKTYHIVEGSESRIVYAGHRELLFQSYVDSDDWSHWNTNFESTSTVVKTKDDAIAKIFGTLNLIPSPINEADHKPIVIPYPATEGFSTYFTGAGDDLSPTPPASGRGEGTRLIFDFAGPGTITKILNFSEIVEVHDGQLMYQNNNEFDMTTDTLSLSFTMPATPVTSTPGTGNCNKVDVGGYNILIPAAGDGQWTLDLNTAIPVPAKQHDGYYNMNFKTGALTVGVPGDSNCNFFDIPITAYSIKELPIGHPLGQFDIEAYKTESFHQRWDLHVTVNKVSAGAGKAAGWLMLFREFTN